MSDLGGLPVVQAELHYPEFGAWYARVILAGDTAPDVGPATLTLEDLALVGAIVRSGLDFRGRPSATVAGGVGWEKDLVAPLAYESDAGVRLSTVLKDVSARAGEPIEQPADGIIGTKFGSAASRPGLPVRVRDVLALLAATGMVAAWRVDPDGVTRFGARPAAAATARATLLRRDASTGVATYGVDSPASFIPGALVDAAPVRKLVLRTRARRLEAEVWQ